MRSYIFLPAVAIASLASGNPVAKRDYEDTFSEWDAVLSGDKSDCRDLAVIFARGTFDSGNVGVWVGGPWAANLKAKHSSVAFHGVPSEAYAATLDDYLHFGAPDSCSNYIIDQVKQYHNVCEDAKIVVSGWSQGALCAHKSMAGLQSLGGTLVAFTTFGDPLPRWGDLGVTDVPGSTGIVSLCEGDDLLCASAGDTSGYSKITALVKFLKDSVNGIRDLPNINTQQLLAVAQLAIDLPMQASGEVKQFLSDLTNGHLDRWLLNPAHFRYGLDSSLDDASNKILALMR